MSEPTESKRPNQAEPDQATADQTASAALSRRRFSRARIPLLVQYRFSPAESYITDYSADLSRGGMFIRTSTPHRVGTVLDLQFMTRDGQRVIQGRGRIVRVIGDGEQAGQAVEFMDFSDADAAFLTNWVKRHLGEQAQPTLRVGRRTSKTSLQAQKDLADDDK